MSDKSDSLEQLLIPYGLRPDESSVYIFLLKHGHMSVLSISKALKLPRTRVYRLLEKLEDKDLIETKLDNIGMKYGVVDPNNLEKVIVKKQSELNVLKDSFPEVLTQIKMAQQSTSPETKVLYFSGKEGLEQISYNTTKALGTLRIYESVNDMTSFMSDKLAEEIRARFVKNHITVHQLTPFTSLDDYTKNTEFALKYAQARYISPKQLTIKQDLLIYNNVYALYQTQADELVGVEIHNPDIATMQKQLFDFVWNNATPLAPTSDFGAASL